MPAFYEAFQSLLHTFESKLTACDAPDPVRAVEAVHLLEHILGADFDPVESNIFSDGSVGVAGRLRPYITVEEDLPAKFQVRKGFVLALAADLLDQVVDAIAARQRCGPFFGRKRI